MLPVLFHAWERSPFFNFDCLVKPLDSRTVHDNLLIYRRQDSAGSHYKASNFPDEHSTETILRQASVHLSKKLLAILKKIIL
jgi:hypothetical protein